MRRLSGASQPVTWYAGVTPIGNGIGAMPSGSFGADWTPIHVSYTFAAPPNGGLRIQIGALAMASPDCFLVDDVVLTRR